MPSNSISVEWQEFLDEVTSDAHAGEPALARFNHALQQFADVFGALRRSLDRTNPAALEKLIEDVELVLSKVVKKVLADRPVVRRGVLGLIGAGAESAVMAAIDEASPIRVWIDTHIVPAFDSGMETGRRIRLALTDAPPSA